MINSLSINLTLLITNQPGVILPHGPPAKWHNPQKCCQAFVEGEEYGRTWRKPSEQGNNQQHSAHIWLQLWGSNQKSCIFCYRKVGPQVSSVSGLENEEMDVNLVILNLPAKFFHNILLFYAYNRVDWVNLRSGRILASLSYSLTWVAR